MTFIPDDIKALIPWESHYFDYKEGQRLHYFDEGPRAAPVLVMVHGNPTWSFYFRSLIAKFSTTYRVVAADFLGMGLSSKVADQDFRAIDRSRELEALLAHLGITKFSLIMHDWGGPIGTRVAVNHSDNIEKIVYLNTTLTETESLPPFIKLAASGPFSKIITATTTQFLHFTTRLGCSNALPAAVRKAYFLPFPNATSRKAVHDFVRDIPFSANHPTHRDLAELACELPKLSSVPILILWGLKDPVFHRGMLKRVAAHFPHAKVIEYPDASHLLLEDKPLEVAKEIDQFLSQDPIKPISTGKKDYIEKDESCGPNLLQSFLNKAAEFSEQSASIEVKLPGAFSKWPFSRLLGTNTEAISYDLLSYQELKSRVLQYQRGLQALGLTPGKRIIMLVSPGHDFLAFSFAIMACGAVPVFIDAGIGLSRLCRCIEDAEADGCIVSARAQLLMLLKRQIFRGMHIIVNASKLPLGFGTGLEFFSAFSAAQTETTNFVASAAGLVAFTSGATGTPKGVIFSNRMLASQLTIFKEVFGVSGGKRDLPLLPIFSLYGAASGVASVFFPSDPGRPLDLDPEQLCKVIKDLSIETSFGSPTLWGKISSFASGHAITLSSLKKVFMAGTSVSKKIISQVAAICPKAELFTPYGATEVLPLTLSPTSQLPTEPEAASNGMHGIAVGKPISGISTKIIAITEGPLNSINAIKELAAGEIGELIVSGANVSSHYLNRAEAETQSKIYDSETIWHRIGDACYLGNDSNIYYCGRVAQRVVANQGNKILYSEPVELIFNKCSKVKRSALISLGVRGAAVAIEPHPEYFPNSSEAHATFINELRQIARACDYTSEIVDFYFFHNFPVDARHNAKIFRDQLGTLAQEGKADFTA